MFHGVSSFRRLHTAFLNVLQSGAYANSPIFHQPCDTTLKHEPALHVYYATKTIAVKDGLPKYKDMPTDFGGSGETLPE